MKRRDLDNQITSVLDALVKAEVIPDDGIENRARYTGQTNGSLQK